MPNRLELGQIVGDDRRRAPRPRDEDGAPDRLASSLLVSSADGPPIRQAVVVTLGAAGALVVRRYGPLVEARAPRVDAIDAVGAGDTFVGILAADLASGRSLDEAVGRAVVGGALSTTRRGARSGMPTATELEAAMPA